MRRETPTAGPCRSPAAPQRQRASGQKPSRCLEYAVITIVSIVLMATFGNHEGNVEVILSYLVAGAIAAILIGDVALRRIGLRE